MTKIFYIKLRKSANISKNYINDACFDISASLDNKPIFIDPGRWAAINTGIIINLPFGIEAQIRPRSGIALKFGVTVLNSPGTIDPGYKGEIKVLLINHGTKRFYIKDGDRIAQVCFRRIKMVDLVEDASILENSNTNSNTPLIEEISRGINGFGSSGLS